MTSSEDKFRKLVAAYEDEVQRKQHKMGKTVDPGDVALPDLATGICAFHRGDQIVWAPSLDVIGTYAPTTGEWTWGWGDESLAPRVRSRIEAVRTQGSEWGIETLTEPTRALRSEHEAWDLALVAMSVARADAIYRYVQGEKTLFLALFEGAPAARFAIAQMSARGEPSGASSSGRMRVQAAIREAPPLDAAPSSSSGRLPVARPLTQLAEPTTIASGGVDGRTEPELELEPTAATRAVLTSMLRDLVPAERRSDFATLTVRAEARPPSGAKEVVSIEARLSFTTSTGEEHSLEATPALTEALEALWVRCRERNGAAFLLLVGKLESTPAGITTHLTIH